MKIHEIPNESWTLQPLLDLPALRSPQTVREGLRERGIEWVHRFSRDVHFSVRKESTGQWRPKTFLKHLQNQMRALRHPEMVLIGEPFEHAPLAYHLNSPKNTLSVAPGPKFERFFYCGPWMDPQLENWKKRKDRIVWVARPYPWRVELAKKLMAANVPLDVYSRKDWSLPCWQGPADDEIETSSHYKYRIVAENFHTHLCHTEKLWNSLRAGCVTFYECDPRLDLPELRGLYSPLNFENLLRREELAPGHLETMSHFMHGDGWEIYSPKSFFDRLIQFGLNSLNV